jgi:YHS domain-containing protein
MPTMLRIHRVIFTLFFAIAFPFAAAAESTKLAMQGYDPVNYFTEARPAKGSPEFSFVWDGERYLFANAKHRDMFVSDPGRYSPQFPGWCAAALTRGEHVVPDPQNWIIIDGKLYLFGKPIGPKLFREDPRLVQASEENWKRVRRTNQ